MDVWWLWENILSYFSKSVSDNGFFQTHVSTPAAVYQPATPEALDSRQLVAGAVVVLVRKKVDIVGITVRFSGSKIESVYDYIHPQKKMHVTHKLVDEKVVWLRNASLSESTFFPGTYTFPFHFIVLSLPSSIKSPHFTVDYTLNTTIVYFGHKKVECSCIDSKIPLIPYLPSPLSLGDSIMASGNWRDILVYQFEYQHRVAFQNLLYDIEVLIFPIVESFVVHSATVYLVQKCTFDKVRAGRKVGTHTETNRFVVFQKDLQITSNCVIPIKVVIPRGCAQDINGCKKTIYPTVVSSGFSTSHSLKISLGVSERSPATTPSATSVSRTSSFNSTARSNFTSGSSTDSSTSTSSKHQPLFVPAYTAYHCRHEASRYKRVEITFKSSIFLLPYQSSVGSRSPPNYTEKTKPADFPIPASRLACPPKYSEVT